MKKLIVVGLVVLALVFAGTVPAFAGDGNNGATTCKINCTKVVKCPEGYGHAVLHINGHLVMNKQNAHCNLNVTGQLLVKPEEGKNCVVHLKGQLIGKCDYTNGVVHGQIKLSTNGNCECQIPEFHCLFSYDGDSFDCKCVPVGPPAP